MVVTTEDAGGPNAVFGCLAERDRRRVLGILIERDSDPITRRALAETLVAGDEDSGIEGYPGVHDQLYHFHLPKLEAANLVRVDGGAVSRTAHPAYADTGIVSTLCGDINADVGTLDALFWALSDPRRRTILDVLSHQFGPIHRETLARELAANEFDVPESQVDPQTVDHLVVGLYHAHLPGLAEAGFIEYDHEERTVSYVGHPILRVPWMHSMFEPQFRASLTGEAVPTGVGEIEGRQQVVSYGQSLCDRAEEELFCLFTDRDLLEAGCFTRIRDAARRGTDVYIGTHDPTTHDFVREHAPEINLWEPTSDWMHLPADGGRVGRLVVADREAVMLATIKEENGGHEHEQAVIGEGSDNTLVTIICQLLHPHFAHIDEHDEIEPELTL